MRGGHAGGGSSRSAAGHGAGFSSHSRSHAARGDLARGYFVGDTPYFYEDYPFEQAVAAPVAPQLIVMQTPADAHPEPKAQPLLIELQGDRYVRYGGVGQSSERSAPARKTAIVPDTETATVLIYRDGRREQVPDYAIVGPVLYARTVSNDGSNGYAMKNIQLSALDIAATTKANRENGVAFVLPAGPNEVVTRP